MKYTVSLISGCLARYLKAIDISISKSFKSKMRSKYTKYYLEQNNFNAKVF